MRLIRTVLHGLEKACDLGGLPLQQLAKLTGGIVVLRGLDDEALRPELNVRDLLRELLLVHRLQLRHDRHNALFLVHLSYLL